MSASNSTVTPPWGAFPSEQYLIRNWEHESSDSPSEQRHRLIRAFLSLDEIPTEWDGIRDAPFDPNNVILSRVPSVEEIEKILVPWRDSNIRETAFQVWHGEGHGEGQMVLLRTFYPSSSHSAVGEEIDTDEMFSEWLNDEYDEMEPWQILNSAAYFDHADWSRVYDTVPELAGPHSGKHSRQLTTEGDKRREDAQAHLQEDFDRQLPDESDEKVIYRGAHALDLQAQAVDNFLLVADAEAFCKHELQVLWTDTHGDVVRWSRISPADYHGLIGGWYRGYWSHCEWFQGDPFKVDERRAKSSIPPAVTLGEKYVIMATLAENCTQLGLESAKSIVDQNSNKEKSSVLV